MCLYRSWYAVESCGKALSIKLLLAAGYVFQNTFGFRRQRWRRIGVCG